MNRVSRVIYSGALQQRELKSLRAANAALNARLRAIENVIAKSSATERPQP